MMTKTYHISLTLCGPIECRAESPRKAIEAHIPNPDEVAITWRTTKIGNLYRTYYEDGNTVTMRIGSIRVEEESE